MGRGAASCRQLDLKVSQSDVVRTGPESQGIFCFFRKSKMMEYVQKDT